MENLIYVCGKEEKDTRWVMKPAVPFVLDQVDLPSPLNRNTLCETRFLLWLWKNFFNVIGDREVIGLFHSSYPRKFERLPPPHFFAEATFPTNAVMAACLSFRTREVAEFFHPGMGVLLDQVCQRNGWDYYGTGLVTNSFIAHRTVWYSFLKWFRTEFDYWDARYGDEFPFACPNTRPWCRPAYFYERLTTLWFQNSGLRVTGMRTTEGSVGFYQV